MPAVVPGASSIGPTPAPQRAGLRVPSNFFVLSAHQCICRNIMAGLASPADCALFDNSCVPDAPVGTCTVSTEDTCRMWHEYGGVPDLREQPAAPDCVRCAGAVARSAIDETRGGVA